MPRKLAAMPEPMEPLIREIRGERVILDADLARVFGVSTKVLNQSVKRSSDRFPADFAFQLSSKESQNLRSQIVTSSTESIEDKFVATRRGGAYRPWAFTEHGALMAANVLRSERAVQMSVYVVRAFISQREQLAAKADVLRRMEKMDEKLMEHDEALLMVWEKIKELMRPAPGMPPQSPKRRIGFHW
jgi:hypothetical protein